MRSSSAATAQSTEVLAAPLSWHSWRSWLLSACSPCPRPLRPPNTAPGPEARPPPGATPTAQPLDQDEDEQAQDAEATAADGDPAATTQHAAAPATVLDAAQVDVAALAVPHARKTSCSGSDIVKRTSTAPCTSCRAGTRSRCGSPSNRAIEAIAPATRSPSPPVPVSRTSSSAVRWAPKAAAYCGARVTPSRTAASRASWTAGLSGRRRQNGPDTSTSSS